MPNMENSEQSMVLGTTNIEKNGEVKTPIEMKKNPKDILQIMLGEVVRRFELASQKTGEIPHLGRDYDVDKNVDSVTSTTLKTLEKDFEKDPQLKNRLLEEAIKRFIKSEFPEALSDFRNNGEFTKRGWSPTSPIRL